MIAWLYRYVFRGVGVLLLAGMITILILAISSQTDWPANSPAQTPASTQP